MALDYMSIEKLDIFVFFIYSMSIDYRREYMKFRGTLIRRLKNSHYISNENTALSKEPQKEKAFFLMAQVRLALDMIDRLTFPSLTSIAKETGLSKETLYKLWKEKTGEPWVRPGGRWEAKIIDKNRSGIRKYNEDLARAKSS